MTTFFSRLQKHYEENPQTWYLAIAIFGFLVYHYRLDLIPQRADEPTRTVVALDMILSGNYWAPTINGEWYYRKPPFYNWILAALMNLTGSKSDFLLRLPSTIPLFLFGFTIYQHSKKYIAHLGAFMAAAMFVTCGRMLVYAAFLGHIDIFYSWLTYLAFIALFEYGKRDEWLKALMISYVLHAIAFLCKGLPSVLFAGLSAIPVIWYFKNWKYIFNWRHLLSFGVFAVIISAYFYKYSQYNALNGWVDQLWDQSAQRTVMDDKRQWYDALWSLVKFPLDHLMHLAPWSLFFPLLFFKGFRKALKQSDFLKVLGLIFLANIPVYWLSPGYYPRYLFMLYPIVFVFVGMVMEMHKEGKYVRVLHQILLVLLGLVSIAPLAVFFVELKGEYMALKVAIVMVLGVASVLLFAKLPKLRYLSFVFAILVFRLSFNFFILEERKDSDPHHEFMRGAVEAARITGDAPLYLYYDTPFNHGSTFYVEREKNEILRFKDNPEAGEYYLINESFKSFWPPEMPYEDVYKFRIRFQDQYITLRKAL